MVEEIGTVIRKGFGTWTRNLNICVPFIFEVVTAMLFFVLAMLIFTALFIVPIVSQQNIDPANVTPDQMLAIFISVFSESMWLVIVVGLILLLFYILFQSFFAAGAIKMASQASEKGNTGLADMIRGGKENFINLFLTNILVLLLAVAGLVFLVPGIILIGDLDLFISNPQSSVAGASLLTIGLILWVLYVISLSIIFLLVDYALVIDGLDPITAIEKGISVFRQNMLTVFMMWLLVIGISFMLRLLGEATSYIDVIAQLWSFVQFILNIIVIQPLITVWLTRFYLNREDRKLYSFDDYLLDH